MFGLELLWSGRRPSARVVEEVVEVVPVDEAPPLFEVREVCKDYATPEGVVRALNRASASLGEGTTAIVGPSGGGKSTLLSILAGLMPPTSGRVFFRGKRVPYEDERDLRAYRAFAVAVVFQDLNLISHLTALENAALPRLCQGDSRAQALTVAQANLERVGLADLAQRRPHQLSRGQKQRVAVARAFTSRAKSVVADEPTGSLDPANAEAVMEAFAELARLHNRPVVLVTHEHSLARKYCDHVLECRAGVLRPVEAPNTVAPKEEPS